MKGLELLVCDDMDNLEEYLTMLYMLAEDVGIEDVLEICC